MARWRALCRLVLLLAVEAAAVVVLSRLGSTPGLRVPFGDLPAWLSRTPVEDVVVASLRVGALALGWWLLAGTALYVLSRAAGIAPATRALRYTTLPAARRLADRAIVAAVATGCVVSGPSPAVAADAVPPPPAVVAPGRPVPVTRAPAPQGRPDRARPVRHEHVRPGLLAPVEPAAPSPNPRRGRADESTDDGSPRRSSGVPGAAHAGGRARAVVRTVVAGDSLWSLAAWRVGTSAPDAVGRYWLAAVAANRGRLRSGDPDLIYPGERVVLPPLEISHHRG